MKCVLSIHDTTPRYRVEIEEIARRLEGITKSWLVTPLWHGKYGLESSFASILGDDEKVLHGLTHEGQTDPYSQILFFNQSLSREFRGLDRVETHRRLKRGKNLFEESFGYSPDGFIPPNWYHNSYSLEILKELGFAYTETWTRLLSLNEEVVFQGLPLSFDYGNNFALSRICLWYSRMEIRYRKPKFIRFAIHPQDIEHGFFEEIYSRVKLLEEQGYEFCSYSSITAEA